MTGILLAYRIPHCPIRRKGSCVAVCRSRRNRRLFPEARPRAMRCQLCNERKLHSVCFAASPKKKQSDLLSLKCRGAVIEKKNARSTEPASGSVYRMQKKPVQPRALNFGYRKSPERVLRVEALDCLRATKRSTNGGRTPKRHRKQYAYCSESVWYTLFKKSSSCF